MALNIIPTAGQTLNATRDPIRNNFTYINDGFAIDHVELNSGGNGKHNKVTLPVQGAAPTFAAGEVGLFNLLSGTVNELHVHSNYYGGTRDVPATKSILSTNARSVGEAGYTYLPSGLIIQWGSANTGTVNLAMSFPTAFLGVVLTPYMAGTGVTNALVYWVPQSPHPTNSFIFNSTVNGSSSMVTASYIAIGY